MKRPSSVRDLLLLSFLLLLAACSSNSNFGYSGAFGLTIGGTPPDDAVGTQPTEGGETGSSGGTPGAQPTQPPICDPLGGGGTGGTANSGIVATLRYFPQAPSSSNLTMANFAPGQPDVVQAANNIFLSRINKKTSPFDQGFSDSKGATLKAADGTNLIEYFALYLKSDLQLGANDTEGDYEFAVMSDDGSIVYFDQGSGFQVADALAINNDGTHPNKIGCSSKIAMKKGQKLPMELGYFQAPRVRISLMFFWRTGASLNTPEPLCTSGAKDDGYFFNANGDAQAGYNEFLARGWKVLEAENYVLPGYIGTNPCL